MAGSLGQTDAAGHHGLEDELAEVAAYLRCDVRRKARPAVGHGEDHPGDDPGAGSDGGGWLDRMEQLRQALEREVLTAVTSTRSAAASPVRCQRAE